MLNLLGKNVHSFFLTFTAATPHQYSISGLGLVTATTDIHTSPNVLQSSMLRFNASLSSTSPPSANDNGNNNDNNVVVGFVDHVGHARLVTESLGFESSDEIHSKNNGDENENGNNKKPDDSDDEVWRRRRMKAEGRGKWNKVRSFPPPLSSLNRNGKPSFYLRPVRKDGRLELTEVRIQRSEILHASRHNGRLTLRLIPERNFVEAEEEEEEEEEVEEIRFEKREEEEEEKVGEWRGLRRCHEMVNQHHGHVHGNLRMCGIGIV